MNKKIITLILILHYAIALRCQVDTSAFDFHADTVGEIYNKHNIDINIKSMLDSTFKGDVVFFKRDGYGNSFNSPTRNVKLVFKYSNYVVVYYIYKGRYRQNRILVISSTNEIIYKTTYCEKTIAHDVIDLIDRLNKCKNNLEFL